MKDKNATVIVDISPREEDIFSGFKRVVRKGIRRAINAGLTVEVSNEWRAAYNLYRETCKRNNMKLMSFEDFQKGSDKLFICKKGDKITGLNVTWFVDKFDIKIPRVMSSAISREYSKDRVNDILYWEIFKYYKGEGYKKFDLGGWQINSWDNLSNVNKFKENYGPVIIYEKDYPLHIALGRKLVRNSRLFWNLNKIIRGKKYDL